MEASDPVLAKARSRARATDFGFDFGPPPRAASLLWRLCWSCRYPCAANARARCAERAGSG